MTTIGGFIDGILDGTIDDEHRDYYLGIVSEEIKRLSRVVTSMMNLAKLEAGETKIKPKDFDLSELITRTILVFEHRVEDKSLEIRGLDGLEQVHVVADIDMIHQVVYNLIDNAVKFTPPQGYIEFGIKEDDKEVEVSIKNSGQGIPARQLPNIFERFYKADRSRGMDKNGTGLGLYIVKTIIDLHGGHITAESIEGVYTEFKFNLPKTSKNIMERIKERDDIMRDERSFERDNAEVNGENMIEGAGRTIEDKTALSDFDTIAESISNKIDEDAADVMEEAIKEIAADSAETGAQGTANRASASANTDNSYGTDAKRNFSGSEDTAMHNSANPGSRTDKDGVSGTMPPEQNNGNINAGGSIPNSAVNNGWNYNQQYYGNAQGYNYNMPPYRQQNGYNGTQGAQPGGVYNQQMYNMPQNPYGYGQYGYYAPPYYQQNVPGGGYNNYGQYPQRPPQNGMNNGQTAPYGANNPQAQTSGKNSSGNGMTGGAGQANQNGQYSPNYQQSGWYNNYGGYNQNVPPYYGYQYPYQPYGNYNQAYGAGYNANAARAASANRSTAQRGKVKKQKPKNVGLRVFVCILAVVILAGITLTGAYFVLSPIDENVLDNPPVSSYSTGSSRIEASAPSDFSGGQECRCSY